MAMSLVSLWAMNKERLIDAHFSPSFQSSKRNLKWWVRAFSWLQQFWANTNWSLALSTTLGHVLPSCQPDSCSMFGNMAQTEYCLLGCNTCTDWKFLANYTELFPFIPATAARHLAHIAPERQRNTVKRSMNNHSWEDFLVSESFIPTRWLYENWVAKMCYVTKSAISSLVLSRAVLFYHYFPLHFASSVH